MKEKRIKELENELKYLISSEIKKEVEKNALKIEDEKVNIKELAKEIYSKRGIDVNKLNKGVINNLSNTISEISNLFKTKDKEARKKMIMEIIYIAVLLLLMKMPFDLVRDIGYEYIEMLSSNHLYYNLWNLLFLIIYTITIICAFIVFMRNFINKYKDTK